METRELILGIIPARSGSKGIPGKNKRLLGGCPLIQYTIEAARASGIIDRLVLSTDSGEIAEMGKKLGAEAPFLRPPELARDDTPMRAVAEHAVSFLSEEGWSPQITLILQPTSPLRQPKHITQAVSLLRSARCSSVVSVVPVPLHLSPDYVMKVENDRLVPFLTGSGKITRRQDTRPAFSRDGTIYAFWTDVLRRTHDIYGENVKPLVLPREESVTLDTPEDWEFAEMRIKRSRQP